MSTLSVWLDFLCPFARIAALWLRNVEAAGGLDHEVAWKAFSLEQVNLPPEASRDELWGDAPNRRGLLPLAAGKWAQARGEEVFRRVQVALFDARHVDRKKIGQPQVLEEVLGSAGLDGAAVVKELEGDPRWLRAAREEAEEAERLGVFGVPTLQFPGAAPLFCRLTELTEGRRAVELYQRVKAVAMDPVLQELKRPVPRPADSAAG